MVTGSDPSRVPIDEVRRYPSMRGLLVAILILLLLGSCASTGHVRKCDGRRGQRVPMGVL